MHRSHLLQSHQDLRRPTLIRTHTAAKPVDMRGNLVKSWNMYAYPAKMFPGGSVMGQRAVDSSAMELEVVRYGWDGALEWSFNDWDEVNGVMSARFRHDFQRDGNLVGYYAPGQAPQAYGGKVLVLGRLTTLDPDISPLPLKDDMAYEADWETKKAVLLWKSSGHIDELGLSEGARQMIYMLGGDRPHIKSVSRLGPNRWYDPEAGEGDPRFHPDNLIMDSCQANIIWIVSMAQSGAYVVGQVVWRVGPDLRCGYPRER